MDKLDLTILRTIQQEFPLTPRPYEVLARKLSVPVEELFGRVRELRRRGVVRRIGVLFDSRKLGFRGHLVAARVEPDAVDAVAGLLDRRDEVTHNYLRTGRFNVWFTVMLPEDGDIERMLEEVRSIRGVAEVVTFPTRRIFKLDASFRVRDNVDG